MYSMCCYEGGIPQNLQVLPKLLSTSFRCDGGLPYAALAIPLFPILSAVLYCAFSKVELTITDQQILGFTAFGKPLSLPMNAVTAVSLGAFSSITIVTAMGDATFPLLQHRDQVFRTLVQHLTATRNVRQPSAPCTANQFFQAGAADELKKFKELLDLGVINQEEFDAKRRQLLGPIK